MGRFKGFSLLKDLLEFALPTVCLVCDRLLSTNRNGLVCRICWTKVDWIQLPICARCGHPKTRNSCSWCDLLPPYVRTARSCAWMPGGVAGEIIYSLKYSGWGGVAAEIASHMGKLPWPVDVLSERAMLVPVPLTSQRLRERGYNQSTLLALELSRIWGIPCREILRRDKAAVSQTRLTPDERLRNVAEAFSLEVNESEVAGKHLILLDDVITTAATLNSCAATLYDRGARTLSYVTFGRAHTSGDRL